MPSGTIARRVGPAPLTATPKAPCREGRLAGPGVAGVQRDAVRLGHAIHHRRAQERPVAALEAQDEAGQGRGLPHRVGARDARGENGAGAGGLDAVGRGREHEAQRGVDGEARVAQGLRPEDDDGAAQEGRRGVVGVAAGHHGLGLQGAAQQGLGVERAAEERVRGEGAGHRRGRAAAEAAGEREALLDPQLEADAGAAGLPEDLGRGQGGGVPRGVAGDPGIRDREHPHAGGVAARRRDAVAHPGDRDAEAVEARPDVRGGARRVAGDPIHGGPTTIPHVATGAKARGYRPLREPRATMPTMSVSSRLGLSRPRLLDRYIVREMLAPTAIGLLVFTFVLLIDQIPRLLAVLVARSADLTTILRVFLNLLPSILAVTIPMAFLLGVLLAFGRLASDSEIVALRAVGREPAPPPRPGDDAGRGHDRPHLLHQRGGAPRGRTRPTASSCSRWW